MMHKVCGLEQLHAVITDLNPKSPKVKNFVEAGVTVL
jgi:hypothetical protein